MTREEILSHKIKPEQAKALSDYLKTNIPTGPRVADPTALVNNEGAMVGWLRAADFIALLAEPKQEEPTNKPGHYSEPPAR